MSFSPAKQDIDIIIDSLTLQGILRLPEKTTRLVIFAHGSGSSRLSSRNNFVAEMLHHDGIGTLLFDLLTEQEDMVYENRFNIDLIAERLLKATNFMWEKSDTQHLKTGYFGASTGAAAALKAAASLKSKIKAVVSRGGRPDMAADTLSEVEAPTLLIVGGNDVSVLDLNRQASEKLRGTKELSIVPGAAHLFEEPGALEEVARLASEWFKKYLR